MINSPLQDTLTKTIDNTEIDIPHILRSMDDTHLYVDVLVKYMLLKLVKWNHQGPDKCFHLNGN